MCSPKADRMPTRLEAEDRLSRGFYDRPTLQVARDLLGKVLVHRYGRTVRSGAIVEVEAYVGETDPACHAAPGPTRRNEPLYGPPGFSYVYLNYGVHWLVNAVTEAKGFPAAVLIRALEPLEGLAAMRRARAAVARSRAPVRRLDEHELCRGPGNLTAALGITLDQNRVDLLGDRLFVADRGILVRRVIQGPRVGISVGTDRPWRFHIEGNPAVSKPGRSRRELDGA